MKQLNLELRRVPFRIFVASFIIGLGIAAGQDEALKWLGLVHLQRPIMIVWGTVSLALVVVLLIVECRESVRSGK